MNDYAARQSRLAQKARRDYEAWVAGLSAEERARLEDSGLADFADDHCRVLSNRGGDHSDQLPAADAADEGEPQAAGDADEQTEWGHDARRDDPAFADEVAALLRAVLGEIFSAPNTALTMECAALVTGLAYQGDSEAEIARRHGLSRAAVSKRCVELASRLGLPPSRAMRTLTARTSYARRRHANLDHN